MVGFIFREPALKVKLTQVASAAPEFVVSPLTGWVAGKIGAEWAMTFSLIFYLPWSPLLIVRSHLALFFVFFALASTYDLSAADGRYGYSSDEHHLIARTGARFIVTTRHQCHS